MGQDSGLIGGEPVPIPGGHAFVPDPLPPGIAHTGGDDDVSRISRKEKAAHREDWKGEAGQSVRPGAEYVFSAFRRMFGGHVAAHKWENAVKGAARKIATYNAIPGASGGA